MATHRTAFTNTWPMAMLGIALFLTGCETTTTTTTPSSSTSSATIASPAAEVPETVVSKAPITEPADTPSSTSTATTTVESTAVTDLSGEAAKDQGAASASAQASTPEKPASPLDKISEFGKQQLAKVVSYAQSHHRGGSNGQCFNAVWGYLTSAGYGKLKAWGDLPNMPSGQARHFAEYLNGGQSRLDEAGLQRLDTTLNPPITNPHDSRIPEGAVIVVSAGSYGTSDPVAGDIVVKGSKGRFINDGPNMDYGTQSTWYGKILGVYVPR